MSDSSAVKPCSVEDCERPHYGRGFCHPHYKIWRENDSSRPSCSVDECDRRVHGNGLCGAHYARWRRTDTTGKKCSIEDCERPFESTALCAMHYRQRRRKALTGPSCSVEGCARPVEGRGLCGKHYQRWVKTGGTELKPKIIRTCTIDQCDRPQHGQELCSTHYARWTIRGTVSADTPIGGVPHNPYCSVEECNRPWHSKDFCANHYAQWKMTGDPRIWNPFRTCAHCEKPFFGKASAQKILNKPAYCTKMCRQKMHASAGGKERKKVLAENGLIEKFSIDTLFARGEDRCHLCDECVFPWETGPYKPTLDHIRPVRLPKKLRQLGYKGGTHTLANVRLAHSFCNTSRGNKLLEFEEVELCHVMT